MSDDHLNNELRASLEMTPTGLNASAKIRTLSSIDRLCGALIDGLSAEIEGRVEKRRRKVAGELQIMEAIIEYGVREIEADPATARRAFDQHFRKVLSRQANKDAVAQSAVRELLSNPPAEEVQGSISEAFYARFEQHAEVAATDELRQLFGALLAGEIRNPGAVPAATMHLASMLDPEMANLIDRILPFANRHGHVYLGCMPVPLSVKEIAQLEMAGFWSSEKMHRIEIEESGSVIRRVGQSRGVAIFGPPGLVMNIEIAILSVAGAALVDIIAREFDADALAKFALARGATRCILGQFEIVNDKWIVSNGHSIG